MKLYCGLKAKKVVVDKKIEYPLYLQIELKENERLDKIERERQQQILNEMSLQERNELEKIRKKNEITRKMLF